MITVTGLSLRLAVHISLTVQVDGQAHDTQLWLGTVMMFLWKNNHNIMQNVAFK